MNHDQQARLEEAAEMFAIKTERRKILSVQSCFLAGAAWMKADEAKRVAELEAEVAGLREISSIFSIALADCKYHDHPQDLIDTVEGAIAAAEKLTTKK